MRQLFAGGTLLHIDRGAVEQADVLVEDGRITDVGPGLSAAGADPIDVSGRWVMPGLTCGHTHLYSALACGMPFLDANPVGFADMLAKVWWRLDKGLDEDGVRSSAEVGALSALKAGVTCVIDHHASPSFVEGSLEVLDETLDSFGLRRILCYEVTDRGGLAERDAGLRAHQALLEKGPSEWRAMLVGGHASFTLSDDSLSQMGALAKKYDVGTHIHVAEAVDDAIVVGEPLLPRLSRHGCLLPGSLFAHCVHLSDEDLARIGDAGALCTHQARSNMNNAVGHARVPAYPPGSVLGTDGIGADMFAELQAAFFRSAEAKEGLGPDHFVGMLDAGSRYASSRLGLTVGKIEKGAAADLVVLEPCPGPPLTSGNLAAAMVFRLSAAQVRDVYTAGEHRLQDGKAVAHDEVAIDDRAQKAAERLWATMRRHDQERAS